MQSPRREPRTLRLGTYHSKIPIIFFFSTFRLVELGDLGLKLNPHECSGPGPEVLPCWWNWPLVWEPLVDVVLSICASGPADLLALEDDFQPQNPVSVSPPARWAWRPSDASSPSAAPAPHPGKAQWRPCRTFVPDGSWSDDGRDG